MEIKILLISFFFVANVFAAKINDHEMENPFTKEKHILRVITPDTYDGKNVLAQIYLLHGAGGSHGSWTVNDFATGIADKYNRIIVCPTSGKTSWYNNTNNSEDYIIKTVIPFVDKTYKTKKDRWLTGFSMGGYGGIRLGHKFPKLFSAYGAVSPCILPSNWTKNWDIASAMKLEAGDKKEDLFSAEMLKKMKKDKRPFVILCGKQDFFWKENEEAMKKLKDAKIPFHNEELDGQHNDVFAKQAILKEIEFFHDKLVKKKYKQER